MQAEEQEPLATHPVRITALYRTFEFQDFVQSLSFVNSLVAYFEAVDHYPDVRIGYGQMPFELTRYPWRKSNRSM